MLPVRTSPTSQAVSCPPPGMRSAQAHGDESPRGNSPHNYQAGAPSTSGSARPWGPSLPMGRGHTLPRQALGRESMPGPPGKGLQEQCGDLLAAHVETNPWQEEGLGWIRIPPSIPCGAGLGSEAREARPRLPGEDDRWLHRHGWALPPHQQVRASQA